MKSSFSAPLISFLQSNDHCEIADLFVISLLNGQVITATSGQKDIVNTATPTPYFSAAPNLIPDPDGTQGTWVISGTIPFNASAGAVTGGAWQATGTGGASGFNFPKSQVINVAPGHKLTVSGYIDASHVSSGSPAWAVCDTGVTTQYATASQTAGVNGRVSATFTVPGGVTQIVIIGDTLNCTIANGQLLSFSDPQLEPTTFYSVQFGKWQRGAITSVASFDLTPQTVEIKWMDNTADMGGPVLFPGTTATMLQAMIGKIFIPSRIAIYTAYMPTYGDTHLGVEVKFIGDILKMQATRLGITFTAYDLTWMLDQQSPPNLYQPPCRHTLFNVNCALNAASFTQSATVAGGSTQSLINTTGALPAVGSTALPYALGTVTWLTGNNKGLSNFVKLQNSSTQLALDIPTFLPVQTGDTFSIIPGCDKTFATCLNTYNNLINFGGMRFLPPGETAL